jgi:hypothetical protein
MHVQIARALTLVIGVLLASQALAQDDSFSNRRDRDSISGRRDRDSFASLRDQIIRPEPPSNYYAQPGSDDHYFNVADEIQTPAPVEQNGPAGTCASCNASANAASGCNACDECSNFCAACQDCPRAGLVLFSGIDSWRGIGDRGTTANNVGNNNGGSSGFNYATRLGGFSEMTGIGLQAGGSFGVYDWDGRAANAGTLNTTQLQQQTFFTTGLFKKANEESSWSFGVVHDWMFNQNWGAYAVNPTLGQWRGQLAYATDAWNEFGAWGTLRDKGDTNLDANRNPVFTRSINQINAFWHHKYEFGGDSWVWFGLPQDSRLNGNLGGNLGDFLVGGSVIAPLTDYLALYGNMQYMHPSATPGAVADSESSWYVAFGLQYYIGGNARTSTVAGNCWLPLLPVANNGNFLVDSVRTLIQ